MNREIETELGAISSSVSRISGLYQLWAQKNNANYRVGQLLYILLLKGAATQKEMAEICEIPKQTVNNAVKLLAQERFIEFEQDAADKRQKLIRLTPLGEQYAGDTLEPIFKLNLKVAERLGIDRIHELALGLVDLAAALELEMRLLEIDGTWEARGRDSQHKDMEG
jgi:DNA-binding MarR family transcriptional regulator